MSSEYTIAHLSDPHLSDPRFGGRVLASPKRVLAYLSWRLRKHGRHDHSVLAAAAKDIIGVNPDAVVVTGDLTQLGLPSEYEQVRSWLPTLGDPARVTLVPGNHDLTCADSPAKTRERWSPWMPSGTTRDGRDAFPSVRRQGKLALIGLSSARPSWPLLATGSLGPQQLERLDSVLQETGSKGCFRVVFLHHPLNDDLVGRRKRLTDSADLREVLDRRGVELVLHGHAHRSVRTEEIIHGQQVPVIGAPSVSEVHKGRARYNLYRLARSAAGWDFEVSARVWRSDSRSFEPELDSSSRARVEPNGSLTRGGETMSPV